VNILIVKLSAIGDVVQSLPFLETLRKAFPESRIDWVVEEASHPILEGHPAINEIIVSRRKIWQRNIVKNNNRIKLLYQIYQFFNELRARRYDWVIDLQGLLKSGVITGLARGERKMGMSGSREGASLFLNERPIPVSYEQHAIDRYLRVADYLGCDPVSGPSPVRFSDTDREAVEQILEQAGIGDRPLVAVHPVAKWPTKLWEYDRFAVVADRVMAEAGCEIAFTGSHADRPVIHDIAQQMGRTPLNLAGRTTLKQLAYLYARCKALVTTDTGPMHIAAAMGCPVVALFGPTAPWRTGPYGKGHRVVRADIPCSPCFKKRCEHVTCMREIHVDRVVEGVKETLRVESPDGNQAEKEIIDGHQ